MSQVFWCITLILILQTKKKTVCKTVLGLTSLLSDSESNAFSITHLRTCLVLLLKLLESGTLCFCSGRPLIPDTGSSTQQMLIHVFKWLQKARQWPGSCPQPGKGCTVSTLEAGGWEKGPVIPGP